MVISILYSVYITTFLIIVFFIALILQIKWVHNFIFKNKTQIYENKPVEINMKLYKKSLRDISIMYVIVDITNFLVFGKTPFLYLFLFTATLSEISAAGNYRVYKKFSGKTFANREEIKLFAHKASKTVNLLIVLYLVVSLPLVGYFTYLSLGM